MSLLLALALFGAPETAAAPAPEADITVLASKLRDWRGDWTLRKGKMACKTRRSTGDKDIDAIGCAAITTCLGPQAAELQALATSKADPKARNARMADIVNAAVPCMDRERAAGVAALADRRAGL